MGLCFNLHLLKKETSLIRVERYTDLHVWKQSMRCQVNTIFNSITVAGAPLEPMTYVAIRVSLILCPFSRIMVVCCPFGPIICQSTLIMVSDNGWVSLCRIDFKVVGYSHNMCATIVPVVCLHMLVISVALSSQLDKTDSCFLFLGTWKASSSTLKAHQ